MARWSPEVRLTTIEQSDEEREFLLEDLAEVIYSHICQAHEARKDTKKECQKSILGRPKDFDKNIVFLKKAGSDG